MKRDLLWLVVERRLRQSVPPKHLASTLGDLAEDYARRLASGGRIRAGRWLIREARSLARAYRAALAMGAETKRLMLIDDVRHAWRRLRARPGQSIVCAGLVALGIGLSTAMFSVVDALLLQPAPFRDPDRLILQGLFRPEPAVMEAWRSTGMFEAVEAGSHATFRLEDEGGRTWPGALVTPGVFDMLGVRPIRGRMFGAADARTDARDVVVLSEIVWRSTFGGDADVVGRRIRLDGALVTVVGIMPASFRFPTPVTVAWRPLDPASAPTAGFRIYGRLKRGIARAEADARVSAIAIQMAYRPRSYRRSPPIATVGEVELGAFTPPALWLLLGGVVLVFVVLCSNVCSLLLAHLSSRRREFGMCTALGASRARLMRQAAAEHLCLAALGTAMGIGLAWSLTAVAPDIFLGRTLNPVDIDVRALAAASSLGVAAVVLAGLVPAWMGTRGDPLESLRGTRQVGAETRMARLATRGLLVGEIALACSLLVGSALLVRSFVNLVYADRGLNVDGVVRVGLGGLDHAFPRGQAMALATAAIDAHVAAWPEVSASALSREIPPLMYATGRARVTAGPGATSESEVEVESDLYRVSAGFFPIYGIPIVRGRLFGPGDSEQDVIIGERLARLLWPGEDPLGRTLAFGRAEPRQVIGVAREIELPTLDHELDRPELYTPLGSTARTLFLNLRCRAACPNEATMRARLASVHPVITARMVPSSEDAYQSHLQLPRATAQVGGLFAIVALVTAAGGLFSVLTYAVGRRRRELGIRAALGASPAQMRHLVVREGMTMVAPGLAAGLLGGWIVARSLAALHYGVTAADPVTWVGVLGTILITSLAAAWRPARQAMRVDPVTLLREE